MPAPAFHADRQRLLTEAIALSRRPSPSPQRWQQLQQQLETFSLDVTTKDVTKNTTPQQPSVPTLIPATVRRCFAEALVTLPQYLRLIQPEQFYGTLASPTLAQYRPIQPLVLEQWDLSYSKVAPALDIPSSELQSIDQKAHRTAKTIEQHRQIMAALKAQFNGLATPDDGLQLFQQLFGSFSIPTAALRHLGTEFQLIFALDYLEGDRHPPQLQPEHWMQLSPAEQQQLAIFLQRLQQFSFQQFANFPSFGYIDPSQINPTLIEQLAQHCGASSSTVQHILQQSIGIIPRTKAESFLIHDIWGHGWQSLLVSFQGDYALLSQADQSLRPGLFAYTADGPLALRQCFRHSSCIDNRRLISLDSDLARQFFHGEVQQRFGHLLTHLIAELLADVQEYQWHWQHPEQPTSLPSSSSLANLPTKLDLTLRDVSFFFPRILEPLLSIPISASNDSLLEQSLLQEWGSYDNDTRGALKQAIAQLQSLFWQEYHSHYLPSSQEPGWFSSFLGNLLQLQLVINQLYQSDLADQEPLFQPLLLLFIGLYCSGNCYQDFWDLDNVLAQHFRTCWRLTVEAGAVTR